MLDFTTATTDQLKQVYNAIAAELGDDRFFTTKELDVMPKILAPMEQVLSFSSGLMDGNTWLIVLTNERILFLDKGMLYGLKQTSIELENIVSIQGETGLMFGIIRISSAASPHEIRNVWKRTVNQFVNKVRLAAAAKKRGEILLAPGSHAPAPAEPSSRHVDPVPAAQDISPQGASPAQEGVFDQDPVPSQLARLQRLVDAGCIDQSAFHVARLKISQ